jgi:hypothetical protein
MNDTGRTVEPGIIDKVRDGMNHHHLRWIGLIEPLQFMVVVHMPVEPEPIIIRGQYDRHPVMKRLHQFICGCREKAAGLKLGAVTGSPTLPEAGKSHNTAVGKSDVIGLLMVIFRHPFIET